MNPSRVVTLLAVLFAGFSISRGTAATEVSFAVTDSWSTGFNGQLTITNNGPAAVNGWSLEFDFPGTITNSWNGAITSHPSTRYVLGNANYNAAIPVGSNVVIGFSADPASAAHPPTGFVFNGVPVGGGGVNPSISINDVAVTPRTAAGASGYLSTSGNQITDSAGAPVRLTGINWFGFETSNRVLHGLWTRSYKSALDQIKGLGFNSLRIPYSNAMLRPDAVTNSINFAENPDLQGLSPLQCLDKIVAYCGQIGLRVILDRHSAKPDGYMTEDVWFVSGDTYYTEQRWIDDWVMLATRYAGNATVIGADLFNEPKRTATWGASSPLTDWNKAAERCGNAILAANPNWLIIVEGTEKFGGDSYWWGGNLKGAATFPVVLDVPNKLVYSMHDYPASVSAQSWFSAPDYPQNMAGVWNTHFGYLYQNNTAPLLLGEFGSKLATASDRQWLDKLTDFVDGDFDLNGSNDLVAGKTGMSWMFWSFNPNSGDTGGIVGDDWTTVDQTKLGYIQASMAPMLGSASAGVQTLAFTVTLSAASAKAATVAWTTVNGTAIAGTDFTAANGTLNFAPGETSKTLVVSLLPNAASTVTRTFSILLSNPGAATLSDASGVATLQPAITSWLQWRSSKFTIAELTDPAISGPAGDPDRDGIPNLIEYALALEPRTASRAGLPVGGTGSISGKTYATFSFAKPRALADITYTVQVSADLQVWNSGPAHAIRTDDASTDHAAFRETTAISDTPRHFIRLQIAIIGSGIGPPPTEPDERN